MPPAPPPLPEPGEAVNVTHRHSLPSADEPPRTCVQFGRALIVFGRIRLESIANESPSAKRLLTLAHETPDNIVPGETLGTADLLFLQQQLESGQVSVVNLKLGRSKPIPHLITTYVAGNDPFLSVPRGSVLLQSQAEGERFPFLLFSRPWISEDGLELPRDPVDAVLTVVERIAALWPIPPAAERVDIELGLGPESRSEAGNTYWRWVDTREASLLESVTWVVPWRRDHPGHVEIEVTLREGVPSDALQTRWGMSHGYYVVSPTHQGSTARHQGRWMESFYVNRAEVRADHSDAGLNRLRLRWPE